MKYSVALLLALCSLCVASTLHQRDAASYRNHHDNHNYDYYNDDDIRKNDNEHYIFKGDRVRKVDRHLIEKQQTVLHLLSNLDHNILPEHLSLLGRTFKLLENLDKFHNKNIVKQIAKSYSQKLFLPENEVFSPSNQQHHNQAAQIFHFLYAARDWDTLKQASVWMRQRMNPHQFAYAFTAAILNHPTTRGVVLPAMYEVMPNLFVPATAMHKIYKANMLGHNSATVQANYTKQNLNAENVINKMFESKRSNYGPHNPSRVFAENDGSMKTTAGVMENMENRMSYFTEDVGINAFHSGFHMQNPAFFGSHMMYDRNADISNNLLYKNVDTMEEAGDKENFNDEYNTGFDDISEEVDEMMKSRRCRNCHHKRDSNEWENTDEDSKVWNGDDNTSDDIMTKKHHRKHKHDHHKHNDNDDNNNIWNVENMSDNIIARNEKRHRDHHNRHHGKNDDDNSNEHIWNNDDSNMGNDMSDEIMSRDKNRKNHHKRHHGNNDNDSNDNIWNNSDDMKKDMSDEIMSRDKNRKHHNRHHGNNDNDSNENIWNNSDDMRKDIHDEIMSRDKNRNRHHGNNDNDNNENIWKNSDNMKKDMSDEIMSRDKNRKNHHKRHHGNNDNDSNENIWNNSDDMKKDMSDEIMSRDKNRKHHNRHHGNSDNDSNENIWNNSDDMRKDIHDEIMSRDKNRKNHHKRHHGNNDNDSNENIWDNSDNMRNDMSDEIMGHNERIQVDNNESLKSKVLNNVGIVMDFILRRDRSSIRQHENSKEKIGMDEELKIDQNNMINAEDMDMGKNIKPKHRRNNKNNCNNHNVDGNCKNGKPVLDDTPREDTVDEVVNKNMYIMNNMNTNDAQAVKRGESFYYAHQQLYARYVLERLSNDLPIPHPLNFNNKIKIGYNPNLQHSNGQAIPARPPNTKFYQQILENTNNNNDALMPNNNQAENPQIYEKRLMEVAESGFVMNKDGSKTEINHQNGIGILANLIAAPADSLNSDYYGDYFNTAKRAIGNIVDPNNNNGVAPGSIANLATAARDPAYYQLLAKMNQIFNNLQNKLGPYTQRQLSFPGVKIEQFDVSRLMTYFDIFTMNVNNALNNNLNMEDENYIIKFERLNNKPFVYKLKLSSDKSTSAVVRIFIGPKYDSNGQRFTLPQASQYFVQLDQFRVKLHRGENLVERNSIQSPNYVQDQPSFKELWSRVQNAKEQKQPMYFDETESRHCGFPQRAQLPKGKPSGQKFVFYAIVTEADRQVDDSMYYNRQFQSFYCGGNNNNKMHDMKTIGYPFDRPIEDVNYNSPNQYFKTVTIYHNSNDKM